MRMVTRHLPIIALLPLLCLLAACGQTPAPPGMKLGKPYTVDGKTYYPDYDPSYDKIGMASWYGPGFDGKRTASGEVFNQEDLTAAHPTLPMPSLVRVTNLKNGHSVIVRINDRGPFASNRIIDLSKRAAEKIGMLSTSEVRVQFLKDETDAYVASLQNSSFRKDEMLAINAKATRDQRDSVIRSTEPSDSENSQLVETTVSDTHTGDTVSDAAPVMSVKSDDLASNMQSNTETKPVNIFSPPEAKLKPSHGIVKEAQADEEVAEKPTAPFTPPAKKDPKILTSEVVETPTAKSGFYIQAGSFSSEENAQKLSSKLAGIGHIDVAKVDTSNKTWWRVRVGPFKQQEAAASALEQVHAANVPDARIIHQ